MRLATLTILLAAALASGCARNQIPPPAPPAQGVPLADLNLKNAPPISIQQVPPPAGGGPAPDLTDIAFASPTVGYGVTGGGTIEKSADGGATWSALYQLKGGHFTRVEVVNDQTAFAAARTGCDSNSHCEGPAVLLRTTDGGQNWTVTQPRLPEIALKPGINTENTFAVARFQFLSAEIGFAAGDIRENAVMRSFPLMATRDGGRSWRLMTLPEGFSTTGGFAFVSAEIGYVTAYQQDGRSHLLATADGGQSWRSVFDTLDYGLYSVDFLTAADGFIGGGKSPKTESQPRQVVLATHDGGKSWEEVSRTEGRGTPVVEMEMISPTEGWAAGGGCWSMGASGSCKGPLLFTKDGGRSWTETGPSVSRIRSAGQRAWVINGAERATKLTRTDHAGADWTHLFRPDAVRVSWLQFLDAQTGFIKTNLGLFQTLDGGKSWSASPAADGPGQDTQFLFLDRQTVLRTTQAGLERSSDGGRTRAPLGRGQFHAAA